MLLDREREPDRVPGSRVGILTDDQDLDLRQRTLEGAQHVVAGRQVAAAGRDFGPEAFAECGDVRGHGLEGPSPSGVDQTGLGELGQ